MITIFSARKIQQAQEKEEELLLEAERVVETLTQNPAQATTRKQEKKAESFEETPFSEPIYRLFLNYRDYYRERSKKTEIATLYVDEIASRVALFYEKIRKIVDWKEEHLVRRAAIERILKRKMISEISGISLVSGFEPQKIAEPLILELIRGGHFPNGKIPRSQVAKVQKLLEKYTYILEKNPLAKQEAVPKIKQKINLYTWMLEIAACEVEELLASPIRQKALMECMFQLMDERIKIIPEGALSQEEKATQLFIAVRRTLFHLDDPIISYHLLKNRWPEWDDLPNNLLDQITQNIITIKNQIEKNLSHSLSSTFFRICEKYDTLYIILGDILDQYEKKPSDVIPTLGKPKELTQLIRDAYTKRLSTLKGRLYRSAVYSTLSIFIAGALSLFIFEVPLAKLIYGEWKPLAMTIDILLPTALMAILVLLVRPPRPENLNRVVIEILKIVYRSDEKDIYEIRMRKKTKSLLWFVVSLFYAAGTIASLALVFWVFRLAKIPVTSLYIDTLNVAMIVSAALVIKQRAKELTIEERTSFWEFSIDILSVPMGKIGQWLSNKWKEYNIVSVFFIALVDMPFSTFIGFIESWSSFLKEKKSEIH
ncbi:MAG TPA: hypothetical protein VMW41_04005 [Candidatus Bathyarchaeia archaeon]|nr:hypothetical protein [Candidatus Bathyarchaeia archaeon]